MFSDGDDNQGIVLGVLFGVVALVIGLVISLGIYKTRMPRLAAAPVALVVVEPAAGSGEKGGFVVGPAGTPAPAAQPAATAGVAVEISVVKIFFDAGQTALPPAAAPALASAAREVAAGRSLLISGFVEASGDLSRNAQLANQRVLNVRDALAALGVPPQKMLIAMPSGAGSTGNEADSRRVDVRVQ